MQVIVHKYMDLLIISIFNNNNNNNTVNSLCLQAFSKTSTFIYLFFLLPSSIKVTSSAKTYNTELLEILDTIYSHLKLECFCLLLGIFMAVLPIAYL